MTALSVRIPTLWALATSEVPLEAWFCTYCILPLPWSFVARPLGPFPLASPTTISQISSSLTTLIFHPFNRKECVRISKGKWKIYNYRYLWCNRLKKNNFFLTAQPPQKEIKKNRISDMKMFIIVIIITNAIQHIFCSLLYMSTRKSYTAPLDPAWSGPHWTSSWRSPAWVPQGSHTVWIALPASHSSYHWKKKPNPPSTHRALDIYVEK